jgi:hypothetical protein
MVSKQFVVFAGLLAAPVVTAVPQGPSASQAPRQDPRLPRLKKFFAFYDCPIRDMAPEFLAAADDNDLDWRLLPSISLIESGGGKDFRNNNIFGWDSCKQRFPSVRASIHIVASRLANSRLYKDKDVDGILSTYNPAQEYGRKVKSVMRKLGSADLGVRSALN